MGKDLERESTMKAAGHPESTVPEKLLHRLLSRLKRHAFYDSLFFLVPPLLVLFYLADFLYHMTFLSPEMAAGAGAAVIGIAVFVGAQRQRSRPLSLRFAARLADARAQGQDRFVTLATIDRSSAAPSLVGRLQQEARGLLHRIDLGRDFSYRLKRSFAASAIISLIAFILFHIFVEVWLFLSPQARTRNELGMLSREMSQVPGLSEMARDLRTLAAEIKREGAETPAERAKVNEFLRRMGERLKAGGQQRGGDALLARITAALRPAGSGSNDRRGEGGGDNRSATGKGGQGQEQRSPGPGSGAGEIQSVGRGEGIKGERPQTQGQELGQRDKDLAGSKRPGAKPERGGEIEGRAERVSGRREGKSRYEEIPRGEPPERFYKPGEGEKSIRGARFVTVQLPEEVAEAAGGEGGAGARRALGPKVPVSNVPLRRQDSPEPSAEKQPLPLEYRELIR